MAILFSITVDSTTIWCSVWIRGIIGQYIFKSNAEDCAAINEEHYGGMITNFFLPQLKGIKLENTCFQPDTFHTAGDTINLLEETTIVFTKWIYLLGIWFVWFDVSKLLALRICKIAEKSGQKEHLKANIRSVIACLVGFTGKSVWKLTLQVHLVFQLKIPRLYLALYERFEFCTTDYEEKVNRTFSKSGWSK